MSNNGIQLRLSDLLFAIRKRWKLIVLLTVIGLIFGIMLSGVSYLQGTMSRNYEITGSVVVNTKRTAGLFTSGNESPDWNDFRFAEEMTDSAIYIMQSERVLDQAINDLSLIGISTKDIQNNLKVSQYEETPIVELTMTWRSADEAVDIMNAILKASREVMKETLQIGDLSEINAPSTRYLVGGGLNAPLWGYMLVFGFVAGIGIAVLELLMRPTLINLNDVEKTFGLETMAIIPRNDSYFRKKKSLLVDDGLLASDVEQNYSAAAYILRNRLGNAGKGQCFYITSATAGEGKTTVAANLAIQLSDMEKHVLLIDFNTQNPGLGKLFLERVDYIHSLNALYRGDATEEEAITNLTGYLDILPMVMDSRVIPMDGTVTELINRISQKYDYVIIDAAAAGVVSDTLSLNQIASTVLFVIRYDSATIQEVQNTLEKLKKSGIRVMGCIVNAARTLTDTSSGGSDTGRERPERTGSRRGRSNKRKKKAASSDIDDILKKEKTTEESSAAPAENGAEKGPQGKDESSGAEAIKDSSEMKGPSAGEASSGKTVPVTAEKAASGDKTGEKPGPAPAAGSEKGPKAGRKTAPPADVPRQAVHRNVLEELDDYMDKAESLSDNDAVDALLRMGMDGSWEGKKDD